MLKHFRYRLITLLTIILLFSMVSPIFAETNTSADSNMASTTTNTELGFELYSPHILLMEASSRKSFIRVQCQRCHLSSEYYQNHDRYFSIRKLPTIRYCNR